MSNEDKKPAEVAEVTKPKTRAEFLSERRAELEAAGELPPHERDAPAGFGQPIEQAPSEEGQQIDGEGDLKKARKK